MAPANLVFAIVVIAYPAIVYFGLEFLGSQVIAFILIAAALARLFLFKRMDGKASGMPHGNLLVAALLLVGVSAVLLNSAVLLQYYPVCINLLLLVLFANSLARPPSLIEQIARIKSPDLPLAAIAYTRKVTIVWCVFFALNGTVALYTVLDADLGIWAIYNSFVSYSLMGLLFAGEYLVRRQVKRNIAEQSAPKG